MPETPCMFEIPPVTERPWQRSTVRAPGADPSFVAVPDLPGVGAMTLRNRELLLAGAARPIQGRSLGQLREWTRREVLRAAHEYTTELLGTTATRDSAALADLSESAADVSLFVGGHQPTLFHPGVWVKNFVVSALASRQGGIGLNLVVDNDTSSTAAIRVPTGTRDRPRIESVAFDEPRLRQPWEELQLVNRELFASFPERVAPLVADWGFEPLLREFWPAAVNHSATSGGLAECLTAARSQWERQRGYGNLELPLSRLCRLEPFLWFVSHLLAHLPRFHEAYNDVVHEYRKVNRLRSRTHPVPDLRTVDGWLEAPFWVWRQGDHVRGRVFARQQGDEIRLSNGSEVFATLPLTPTRDACCAVEVLAQLAGQGVRFRTRALTTTLFARLCLADSFVHGLGGAKYDEMTDRLIVRFFHLPAPGFLTLTATVRLPLAPHPVEREDERRLRRQLRELDFHSERHLPDSASDESARLVAAKRDLIARQQAQSAQRRGESVHCCDAPSAGQTPLRGFERFRRLQEVNRRLAELTQPQRARLTGELSRTVEQLAANAVLKDREFAFCLYPADTLQQFMDHVCSAIGT
ncbi:MAG: hypothetical protein EXS05_21770 [Planctomycetaceae bacterium]|nr:hypothetical protein [Planctomycetaceae bacterium]